MKRSLIRVFAALLAIGAAYFVFGVVQDAQASSSAGKLCAAIRPGLSEDQAQRAATEAGGWYHSATSERASAGVSGWNLICRCSVEVSKGVVRRASQSMCIN